MSQEVKVEQPTKEVKSDPIPNDKILCICGKHISKKNISTHIKTKSHLDLLPLSEADTKTETKKRLHTGHR